MKVGWKTVPSSGSGIGEAAFSEPGSADYVVIDLYAKFDDDRL